MPRILIVLLVLVASPAWAQPVLAVGKPLPDPSLPVGQVVVRVVAGTGSRPVEKVVVTLAIAKGKTMTASTDVGGRARFDGLAPNSLVTVSVPSKAPALARATFEIPGSGGLRVMLSTAPWAAPELPSAREISGKAGSDPAIAAGTVVVRVVYDQLGDPKPPAGVAVTLVGYAADGKITIATKKSDPTGIAQFAALDANGTTAYFAFAIMPRGGSVDRLGSEVFVPEVGAGTRLVLSSHKRDSKEPPLEIESTAVAKGKLRVDVEGLPDPAAAIEIHDAATGKTLATAMPKAPDAYVVFDVKLTAGQVVYAQTTARGETYRSRPVPAIGERGAALSVVAVPRLLQKFDLIARVEDDLLAVQIRFQLQNNSWAPAVTSGGIEVPLPVGFKELVFRDGDEAVAKPTSRGFNVTAPLPPGGRSIILGLSLPIKNTRAEVSMDLPLGTIGSSLRVQIDPGVALVDLPAGISSKRVGDQAVVDSITIGTKKSIRFAVVAPKPDPKQVAIRKACRELDPNRKSPLIDKPLIDFTAPQLDGKPLKLSSLVGKPLLVTFNASFTSLRDDQKTLPAIAKALGAEIVTVLSDSSLADVDKAFGKLVGRVVLDKPVGGEALGPITGSWGIVAVPETYVIDRTGRIKFHIVNQRDWSVPSAAACLRTGL